MSYPHLLSPINLGPLRLDNRVVMAPLTRGRAGPTYTANELMAEYYGQRASAGLIISEGAHPSLQGRGWFETPGVYTPEHAAGWKIVTDRVHEAGGKIYCQLWHTGRGSHSNFRKVYNDDLARAVAPSAIMRKSFTGKQEYTEEEGKVDIETPRALTMEECEGMAEVYRHAAQTAKDGGFDGVEVHCANGYLLDEFLQSCSNERTDKYGGSFENRFRIVDEILTAVSTVFPSHAIGVRLSPNGMYNGMGSKDFRESFLYYTERLRYYNLGYLHVMIGTDFGFHGYGEPMKLSEFRKVYPGVIMANVGYTAETAEREIMDGNADMVSFGRAFINNPDLVERFRARAKVHGPSGETKWFSSKGNRLGADGYSTYQTMEEENTNPVVMADANEKITWPRM